MNAILLTFGTAASCMAALQTGLVKVDEGFVSTVRTVMGGYVIAMLLGWVASMCGLPVPGLFSGGEAARPLAWMAARPGQASMWGGGVRCGLGPAMPRTACGGQQPEHLRRGTLLVQSGIAVAADRGRYSGVAGWCHGAQQRTATRPLLPARRLRVHPAPQALWALPLAWCRLAWLPPTC
jgi:hypothetical protein